LNDRFMADGARAGGQLFEELASRRYASNDATTHVRANDIGRFRVLPHRRELLADGRPISLGERAFDVLMALIETRGAVVGKDALMARVWPDRIVEENTSGARMPTASMANGSFDAAISTRGCHCSARRLTSYGAPDSSRLTHRSVYDRFTEGFDTADLKAAKALVDALAEPAALRTDVS
jgi:hypothetical protein